LVLHSGGWQRNGIAIAGITTALVALKAFLLFVIIPYILSALPSTYRADVFPDGYDLIAMNLLAGNGYTFDPTTAPTMLRTPGFVFVLTGIFSVFGHSLVATKVFNLMFSFATACAMFVLGNEVTRSNRLGLLVATITFLHPAILLGDSRGGVESLLSLSIAVFILLIYRALQTEAIKDYLFAGIAFGCILTIKSSAGLFPLFLFLYLIGVRPSFARVAHAAVRVGVLSLVAATVLCPWVVRNYAISGHFGPTSTLAGLAWFQGYYVVTHRNTGQEHWVLLDEAAAEQELIAKAMGLEFKQGFFPLFYRSSDEVRYYGHLGDITRQKYAEEPALLIDTIGYNFRGFWVQGRTRRATTLNTIIVLPLLTAALWGVFVGWRQSQLVRLLVLFISAFVAAHLLFVGVARYHVPLIPLLAVLACAPLRSILEHVPGGIRDW